MYTRLPAHHHLASVTALLLQTATTHLWCRDRLDRRVLVQPAPRATTACRRRLLAKPRRSACGMRRTRSGKRAALTTDRTLQDHGGKRAGSRSMWRGSRRGSGCRSAGNDHPGAACADAASMRKKTHHVAYIHLTHQHQDAQSGAGAEGRGGEGRARRRFRQSSATAREAERKKREENGLSSKTEQEELRKSRGENRQKEREAAREAMRRRAEAPDSSPTSSSPAGPMPKGGVERRPGSPVFLDGDKGGGGETITTAILPRSGRGVRDALQGVGARRRGGDQGRSCTTSAPSRAASAARRRPRPPAASRAPPRPSSRRRPTAPSSAATRSRGERPRAEDVPPEPPEQVPSRRSRRARRRQAVLRRSARCDRAGPRWRARRRAYMHVESGRAVDSARMLGSE